MNDLMLFSNPEFGEIRTIMLDGEAWLVGKDVAEILGYSNASKALADHVDDEDKLYNESLLSLGQRGGWLVNESGFYSLVLRSNTEKAKRFKRWVTSEVLPSIRKNGGYFANQNDLSDEDFLARALEVAHRVLENREKKLEEANETIAIQKQQILEMQPKASYYDIVLQCKNAIPITMIAKDYGMTANEMNRLLHNLGIQFHIRKTWVLYDQHANQGYTVSKTHWFADKYGRPQSNMVTQWTQKGRLFIYHLLKQSGILPMCER